MTIQVQSGDITKVKANALITAVNSSGPWLGGWYGGMDAAIKRAAGNMFHDQLLQARPLRDGQTIVAKGDFGFAEYNNVRSAAFNNVIFVIDDFQQPLSNIVRAGLKAASDTGFKTVTLPMMRMGVMFGVVEKTEVETLHEAVMGVREFFADNPDTSIQSATFVVYYLSHLDKLMSDAFEVSRTS